MIIPDIYINAGGVTVSYFEWLKNLSHVRFGRMNKRFEEYTQSNILDVIEKSTNKNISKVYYPGLKSHPSHELAKSQMNDFGAMMSFDLNKNVDVYDFLKSLKIIKPGMSLAGVETTVNFPMKTSHGLMTQEERDIQGIGDKLIRLSVGIESHEDLYEDLDQAIKLSIK